MINLNKRVILAVMTFFCILFAFCAGSPPVASPQTGSSQPASVRDDLDTAIRETSDYLNKQLANGNKLLILNVQSEYPALSEYIIDELIANTVNDRVFTVVDRQQLDAIRAELGFQMSGEVSDESAQSIGQMLGAQIIISGAISKVGDLYRLRVRALSVQSAQIEGQFNRNIPDGPTISALANSRATGYGSVQPGTSSSAKTATGSGTTASTASLPTAQAEAQPQEPANTVYKLGDKGPAGGIIFYDKGVFTNGWQYMEAAPNDIGPAQWGAYGTDVNGTSTSAGTGKANTQRIVPVLNQVNDDGAALLCTALNINGYTGWFLPSKDELNLMYVNLKVKGLGGFGNRYYWSSSSSSRGTAYIQNFNEGYQTGGQEWDTDARKNNTYSIRACRQF